MRKTHECAGIRGGGEVTASANIADSIDEVKLRNSEVMEAGRLMTSTQSLTHIYIDSRFASSVYNYETQLLRLVRQIKSSSFKI